MAKEHLNKSLSAAVQRGKATARQRLLPHFAPRPAYAWRANGGVRLASCQLLCGVPISVSEKTAAAPPSLLPVARATRCTGWVCNEICWHFHAGPARKSSSARCTDVRTEGSARRIASQTVFAECRALNKLQRMATGHEFVRLAEHDLKSRACLASS